MDNLTKESVKKRLVVSVVLGVLWTIMMFMMGGFKNQVALIAVLAPVLMTWSLTTLLFFPKEFLNNVIISPLKMCLHLVTLKFMEALKDFLNPFIWTLKTLIKSIKIIFWAFSKK